MRRLSFTSFLLTAVLCAGCGGFSTPETDHSKTPHPSVIGRIDAGLRESGADPLEIEVFVDGVLRDVKVAPDGSFNIKDLPEGSCHIEMKVDDERTASIELAEMGVAELIELDVEVTPSSMSILEVTRHPEMRAYHMPVRRRGGVEVVERNVVYYFDPGEYAGGVEIRGNGVRIMAINSDEPCSDRPRARFAGDIVIRGEDVEVYDLDTRGIVRLWGKRIRVHSPCDDLWVTDVAPSLIDGGEVTVGPPSVF